MEDEIGNFSDDLVEFLNRKKAANLSNSELARRARRSLNTIKSYMRGETVRDTTVQRIHEALNAYVAEQAGVTNQAGNITSLFKDSRSSYELANDALKLCADFVRVLEKAQETAINERNPLDETLREHIKTKLRMAEALLK